MVVTKRKTLLWLLFMVMVSACGRNAAATPTPSPSPTPTTAVAKTPTLIAHASLTLPPTPSPTQSPTTLPTATPNPTATPSFTPTPPTPEFPAWISDPATNVLLLESSNLPQLLLINADTGERYEIDIDDTDDRPEWLWQGDNYYIRSNISNGVMDVINIQTGEKGVLPFVNDGILSVEGRHTVHIVRRDNLEFVTLVDRETGIETPLSNPLDQPDDREYWVYVDVDWSPDGLFLTVEYAKYYSDDSGGGHILSIYTASGELFRQYDNMDLAWRYPWFPGSPYRLLYVDRGVPCILEVVANQQTCLEVINNWAGNTILWDFAWSPDGSKISFIHWSSDEGGNALCYLDLVNETIFCPVSQADLLLDEQMSPRIHFWSPDNRYLVLFFDEFGLGADVFSKPGIVIVRNDGQNKQVLIPEFNWPYPYGNPWRPPIVTQAEE